MGDLPLRTPTHRRLGKPLPYQLANGTHAHLVPPKLFSYQHVLLGGYGELILVSESCAPVRGRLHTCYAPVRRSPATPKCPAAPRLACLRPAASVHPEPGSNSPCYYLIVRLSLFRDISISNRTSHLNELTYYINLSKNIIF